MKNLDTWFAEYLDWVTALGKSRVYVRVAGFQGRAWGRWLREERGVETAERLRREDLEAWLMHLVSRRTSRGFALKPRSVNKQIETVRVFLGWMAERGVVPPMLVSVLEYVREPQLLPVSVLQHAQVKRLASEVDTGRAEGVRDRALLELLYSTGLRSAEVLGLDVGDVDLSQATAHVLGKGGKERVVPIGRTALRFLESYLRGVRPYLVRGAEAALWVGRDGKRMSYPALWRRVRKYGGQEDFGVTVTPHTFRRSCTTELIRAGANLWHVKELLGHENLDTLQHYARLTITDLKKTHAKCHPREREQG